MSDMTITPFISDRKIVMLKLSCFLVKCKGYSFLAVFNISVADDMRIISYYFF